MCHLCLMRKPKLRRNVSEEKKPAAIEHLFLTNYTDFIPELVYLSYNYKGYVHIHKGINNGTNYVERIVESYNKVSLMNL